MGEGLAITMERMEGMGTYVVVDRGSGRSAEIYRSAGVQERDIIQTDDLDRASEAITDGKRVYTTNTALASAPPLDVTVEATGIPEMGAKVAIEAIAAGKHMMQMNVEADATVGAILRRRAQEAGVIYSLSGGDEPGAISELYEFATLLGYEVVSVGKGKNNPLIPTANPDTMAETAHRQMMNPKMLASFVDGSKTMMEMTTISNAIGYVPDRRGMHGPEVTPDTLASTYIPEADGGILSEKGRVDYGLGIAPGVFLVFTTDHPKLVRDLQYLKVGQGPYWALYRPYHLTSLETPGLHRQGGAPRGDHPGHRSSPLRRDGGRRQKAAAEWGDDRRDRGFLRLWGDRESGGRPPGKPGTAGPGDRRPPHQRCGCRRLTDL